MIGSELLETSILGNTIRNYGQAVTIFIAVIFVLHIIKSILFVKIKSFVKNTNNRWDDMFSNALESLGWPFYLIVAFYTATRIVSLAPFLESLIQSTALIIITYYAVRVLQTVLIYGLDQILFKARKEKLDNTILNFFRNALKLGLWVSALVMILQNLGYEVGPLLGGLGIAGVAIAFALQNILSDIFSFFSIYFDKPFKKGDFIIVGEDMGTVEHIGIKSTRVRTLQGQQLIISNQELTSTRVNNYKRMEERRAVFTFGIIYETPVSKVKKIPDVLKLIIESLDKTRFDRAHFTELGESSLNFEVVYYIENQDYNLYRDIQQSINLKLLEAFEKNKVEFAYPTQLVYLKK